MKHSKNPFKSLFVSSAIVLTSFVSMGVKAQLPEPPVVCPGYEPQPTKIVGERVGKKIQKAFELYSADMADEALEVLREVKTKDEFDRAYTDRFIGNLLAVREGGQKEALGYLTSAATPGVLSASEQEVTIKNVADLNLQQENFEDAIVWYEKWLDYTCKENATVYLRISNSYYQSKQMEKVIEPADKAIALFEKPDKNPYILKMSSYVERKQYDKAKDVAEVILQIFPEEGRNWIQLGFYYMQLEDYGKALSTFEMAHNQGFLTKESQLKALAQLYGTNEVPHRAALIQEKYIGNGLIKRDRDTLSALANSWHQAREYSKAAKYYGEAAAIDKDANLYKKQGSLLLTAEDYKGAEKALKKALELGISNEGQTHIELMQAYFYQEDYKSAYQAMLKAKQDNASSRTARSWESYIKEKAKNRGINI